MSAWFSEVGRAWTHLRNTELLQATLGTPGVAHFAQNDAPQRNPDRHPPRAVDLLPPMLVDSYLLGVWRSIQVVWRRSEDGQCRRGLRCEAGP